MKSSPSVKRGGVQKMVALPLASSARGRARATTPRSAAHSPLSALSRPEFGTAARPLVWVTLRLSVETQNCKRWHIVPQQEQQGEVLQPDQHKVSDTSGMSGANGYFSDIQRPCAAPRFVVWLSSFSLVDINHRVTDSSLVCAIKLQQFILVLYIPQC